MRLTIPNVNQIAVPVAIISLLTAAGSLLVRLATAPPSEVELAGYATSLQGRTPGQRHNARLAALAIDGRVIGPGQIFSFNKTVKSWSIDQGYVKAPVSYDGELIPAYGGGVCQTSTTLYNAALLAGMTIVERHPHVFAPHYASAGRDAAVAQRTIDLRFRNPYPWPVRIRARVRGNSLDVRLIGRERPAEEVQVVTEVLSTTQPARLTRVVYRQDNQADCAFMRSHGATGYRVIAYRIFSHHGREIRRERLSDDTYPAMNRVVQLNKAVGALGGD